VACVAVAGAVRPGGAGSCGTPTQPGGGCHVENAGRTGPAVLQHILSLPIPRSDQANGTHPVAKDDMVAMATKMIQLQRQFRAEGKPAEVTIAWHYTSRASLEGIRENGLMTMTELQERGINVTMHGAVYGPGVYTANNPHHFRGYGDTCLLLAVLRGRETRVTVALPTGHGADTVIGNKEQQPLVYSAGTHPSTLSAIAQYHQQVVARQTPHGRTGAGGGSQHNFAAYMASASAAAYFGIPPIPGLPGAAGAALSMLPAPADSGHVMAPHEADEIVLQRSDQVVPVFVVANPTEDCWCAAALQKLIRKYFSS